MSNNVSCPAHESHIEDSERVFFAPRVRAVFACCFAALHRSLSIPHCSARESSRSAVMAIHSPDACGPESVSDWSESSKFIRVGRFSSQVHNSRTRYSFSLPRLRCGAGNASSVLEPLRSTPSALRVSSSRESSGLRYCASRSNCGNSPLSRDSRSPTSCAPCSAAASRTTCSPVLALPAPLRQQPLVESLPQPDQWRTLLGSGIACHVQPGTSLFHLDRGIRGRVGRWVRVVIGDVLTPRQERAHARFAVRHLDSLLADPGGHLVVVEPLRSRGEVTGDRPGLLIGDVGKLHLLHAHPGDTDRG